MMGAEIELLKALFIEQGFEAATAPIQGEKVYRVEVEGLRHYVREGGRAYKSLTTFLDAVLPPSKHLQSWREKMAEQLGSGEAVDNYVEATADYGTALHIAVANFCRDGGVNWAEFEGWAFDYLVASGFNGKALSYALTELTKDFAAIVQFFHDYDVRVLAVEIPVFSPDGYATLIDLVVEMNAKMYDKTAPENRKRVNGIINLKSGKKGFYETHVFQLEGERRMFNATYGAALGYQIDCVFNLSPKDWKKTPTYSLKDQTENADEISAQFALFAQLAKLRGVLDAPKRTFLSFSGHTAYGASPLPNIQELDYNGFSTQKIKQYNDAN